MITVRQALMAIRDLVNFEGILGMRVGIPLRLPHRFVLFPLSQAFSLQENIGLGAAFEFANAIVPTREGSTQG